MSTVQQLAIRQLQYSVTRVVVASLQISAYDTVPIQDNVFCSLRLALASAPSDAAAAPSCSRSKELIFRDVGSLIY